MRPISAATIPHTPHGKNAVLPLMEDRLISVSYPKSRAVARGEEIALTASSDLCRFGTTTHSWAMHALANPAQGE